MFQSTISTSKSVLPKKKKLVKVKGNKINKRKQKFNPKKKENKNGLRNH